jgi:hypothetical protein
MFHNSQSIIGCHGRKPGRPGSHPNTVQIVDLSLTAASSTAARAPQFIDFANAPLRGPAIGQSPAALKPGRCDAPRPSPPRSHLVRLVRQCALGEKGAAQQYERESPPAGLKGLVTEAGKGAPPAPASPYFAITVLRDSPTVPGDRREITDEAIEQTHAPGR